MHEPKFVLENETFEIFWDFEMQTNHLILARRPDQVRINKERASEGERQTDRQRQRQTEIERELVVWWIMLLRWTTD